MGIVLTGLFFGVLARVVLPYLRKLKEATDAGKPLKVEARYVITAFFSLVASMVAAVLILPNMPALTGSPLIIFALAFSTGWACTDMVNQVIST